MKYNNEYLSSEEIKNLDLDIETDFDYFISEWNKLLKRIKDDLLKAEYSKSKKISTYLAGAILKLYP